MINLDFSNKVKTFFKLKMIKANYWESAYKIRKKI